jgi:glucose/arabinose dehydrogenase
MSLVVIVTWILAVSGVAVALPAEDTVGVVDQNSGLWALRDGEGNTFTFYYGNPGDVPFAGDWDCDGVDTPGLYRQSDGFVYLRNSNSQGNADITFFFGNPGDVPIAGDFNDNGCDTVSIYRPSQSRVFIVNQLGEDGGGLGPAEVDYIFGNPGDTPFTGDFDGDGTDTVGLYRSSNGSMYFRNSHTQGNADNEFFYGNPGDRFVGGDWNGNATDSPGVFRPSQSFFYLKHTNTQGNADESFGYGSSSSYPVGGNWGDIPAIPDIGLSQVASGLSQPVAAVAPVDDDRLFIAERTGAIKILKNGSVTGTFLNVQDVVVSGDGGLIGLAFHPNYAANGRFFVHITASTSLPNSTFENRIVEYHATPASDVADPNPVRTIIRVGQPRTNHNGGAISFGSDGYLYIPIGDGGKQNDPDLNGQNKLNMLASILRLSIDGGSDQANGGWYAIPAGNPYNGANGLREIWAIGIRSPWRSSIDRTTGDLYVGDVGQGAWEEITVGPSGAAGLNHGWRIMEGNVCRPPTSGCNTAGLTFPILAYPNGGPASVIGGYVYRGDVMPALRGTYFYAEFYDGWVRSFRNVGGATLDQRDWESTIGNIAAIAGFGEDGHGELYILTFGGTVHKIVPGA